MIKLPIPNNYLIEVPMDAKVIEVSKKIHISLPIVTKVLEGNYRLISSNIANITEEQAKGILPSFEEPKGWINYVDYVNGGKETKGDGKRSIVVGFSEALPALHSAFDSVGAVWRNKLGEKPKADIINDRQTLLPRNAGSIILWDEAQSLVKRFVLIEKEGRDE